MVGLQVQVITGLEGKEVFLSVYPNPADEEIRLTWRSNSDAPVSVTLSDLNGKVMSKQTHTTEGANGGECVIPIGQLGLANGMYLLQVGQGGEKRTLKVMKR